MAESKAEARPGASEILRMTADVVSAYVSRNDLPPGELPDIINTVHRSLVQLDTSEAVPSRPEPAVPLEQSVTPDYLVCLEDGRRLKMLKRHLRAVYGLTPDEYRARWNLPADYPMVAPNYAEERSAFAKKIGLGKNRGNGKKR